MAGQIVEVVDHARQVSGLLTQNLERLLDAALGTAAIFSSTAVAVRIAAIGLRSSCPSMARNSSFRRFAATAAS